VCGQLHPLYTSFLVEEGRDRQSKSSSEDLGEQLALGTVEIISHPADTANARGVQLTAILVAGEGSASSLGTVNGEGFFAGEALSVVVLLAVGDLGSGAGLSVGGGSLVLLAQSAVGDVGGGTGLFDGLEFAVSNLGDSGDLGLLADGGFGGGGSGVVVQVLTGLLADSGVSGIVVSVLVGTLVPLGVGNGSGQGGLAVIGGRSLHGSGANFT